MVNFDVKEWQHNSRDWLITAYRFDQNMTYHSQCFNFDDLLSIIIELPDPKLINSGLKHVCLSSRIKIVVITDALSHPTGDH